MPTRRALFALFVLAPASFGQAPTLPPPMDIAGLPGTLVIVGGGTTPDAAKQRLVNFAGGKEKARIVVIPTASADADDGAKLDAFVSSWTGLVSRPITLLHTRNRDTANDPAFWAPLDSATAVWFSGGDQSRITAAYKGTLVEKKLHALFARGGVIGGTSAGAAIMSRVMITGGQEKATVGTGFGFLPGTVIDQHALKRNRVNRLLGVLSDHPGLAGIAIDEATALVVRRDRWQVIGKSYVVVCRLPGNGQHARFDVFEDGDEGKLDTWLPGAVPGK
jgi:cyanophycinase